jgi:hypothetical protein
MKPRDVTFVLRLVVVAGLGWLTWSCSDDDTSSALNQYTNTTNTTNNQTTNSTVTNNRNAPTNNIQPPPDNPSCHCSEDQVCDITTNSCIAKPSGTGGIIGEVFLLNQVMEGDMTMGGHLGKATADFWDEQPYPVDDRESFATPTGRCYMERGEDFYPSSWKGQTWPTGDRRGAGDLTINVAGAPGHIILNQEDRYNGGYTYSHNDVPPPLQSETSTYSQMFDPQYVPLGGAITVEAAGGPDIPAGSWSGAAMAYPFTISSPPDYNATQAKVDKRNGLAVTWSPAQPDAKMIIIIGSTTGSSMMRSRLKCVVKDDGSTQIPPEALTPFSAETDLQLQRDTVRYLKTSAANGKDLHLFLSGRHARIRRFYIE